MNVLQVTGIQPLLAYPENHVEIWLVTLFLLKKKFHAKQTCVLTGFLKFGAGNFKNKTYNYNKHNID